MSVSRVLGVLACASSIGCTFLDRIDDLSEGEPTFVRVASAVPQMPTQHVDVPFEGTTSPAHDLNVVVIGWNTPDVPVLSVTDSKGNHYTAATKAMATAAISQMIYYASGVVPGNETVSVDFQSPVMSPDVRVVEYRGGSTFSAAETNGDTGTTVLASAGSVEATHASQLVLAAGTTLGRFLGAGDGFTQRVITEPDADLVEDRITADAESVTATANVDAHEWVMQVVLFR